MTTSNRPGWLNRVRLRAEHETWMMMSGLLAMCVLLVVGILVLPLFGTRVATLTAVTVVLGIVVICYFICVPPILNLRRGDAAHREHARDQQGSHAKGW